MTPEEIARHEAGHAAMAVLLGVGVRCVGLDPHGGYVEYDAHSHTPEGAVNRMLIILAGLIESARTADDLPTWPLNTTAGRDGEQHDRTLLKTLADTHELTESGWETILITALTITSKDRFYRMLVTATCGLLDYRPILNRELLANAIAIADRRS